MFTDDAGFVDIRGTHHRAAAAIADGHQEILDSIYAGSTVRYQLEEARGSRAGCVVGSRRRRSLPRAGRCRASTTRGSPLVATVPDEGWVIAAFHNTLVRDGS